ncbi:hypothetical protein ACIBAG_01885 [Streptomyces sp. NPDC051243]|uniref:hypothetical protein n=1 Tax=Streptomyces sp. NPDC051243 TaxID=3365646 RepID=UPI00379DE63A
MSAKSRLPRGRTTGLCGHDLGPEIRLIAARQGARVACHATDSVLGGCGAWPTTAQACSGHLIEYAGFRLLVDSGYATLPRLFQHSTVDAVDAVLALDKPSMLAGAYRLHEFDPGDRFGIGPFTTDTWLLPHFVPNAGIRLATPGSVLACRTPRTSTGCRPPTRPVR